MRGGGPSALDLLEDEIEDRFGPLPDPVQGLIALARLNVACRRLGVARLDAGPDAAPVTLRGPDAGNPPLPPERRGDRLVLTCASRGPAERIAVAENLLDLLDR